MTITDELESDVVAKYSEEAMRAILESSAGLTDDNHGHDTPARFIKMIKEMTACSPDKQDRNHLDTCIKWKAFPSESDEMIILDSIPFTSLCNHHVVPFIGVAHAAYVPNALNAGLSKFARIVKHFGRQLQVQERMTAQIADMLESCLEPRGVAVVLQAEHMCMSLRGVQAPGVLTTTSSMRGVFADHKRTAKAEFLAFVNSQGRRS